MLYNQRIIHNDNGTLRELSRELNDLAAQTAVVNLAVTDDFLYIGSDLPFNHRFFQISVVNAVAGVLSVDIWDGEAWTAAVEVIDGTANSSGVPFAQSGVLSWTLDRNSHWNKEATTENMTGSGLTTRKIYDLYWVRIKASASMTSTTALAYVGHRFADDALLGLSYPDLIRSEILTAFTAAKTNWQEQHVLAAEEIVNDLRQRKIVWNANQVLAWEQFQFAAAHKVAEIIYRSFDGQYEEQRAAAMKAYQRAITQGVFVVDRNENGRIEQRERRPAGRLTRS